MAQETAVDQPEDPSTPPAAEEGALAAPQIDQRAHRRITVYWQGAVVLNGRPVLGRISDLSRGGLSFMSEVALPMHSQHTLYIRMPNNDRTGFHELETVCKVMNTILVASQGQYRMGMKLAEMRGNSEILLTQYITLHGG